MRMLAIWGLLFVSPVFAVDHENIVNRAFEAIDDEYRASWAYTETSLIDDLLYVASYDARRPHEGRWVLTSVDERKPTIEEIEWFQEKKAKAAKDKQDEQGRDEQIFQSGTLNLVEETSEYWLYRFVPADDEDHEKFMQNIDGILKVVKAGHYVEYFDLKSETPFKPQAGVKINSFHTRLTFAPANGSGPVVPQSVDVRVEGRAFLAIKLDEKEKVRYTNYEYVGAQ